VLLGYSNVQTGQAAVYYDGEVISYIYPIALLRTTKNLVYNNGGAQIYK
jgi:hypothetical protein